MDKETEDCVGGGAQEHICPTDNFIKQIETRNEENPASLKDRTYPDIDSLKTLYLKSKMSLEEAGSTKAENSSQ